jgi:hypothetical protein
LKLIDKIEINYFRSIYGSTAGNLRNLNIFVGGNDSGKSNILRALNLFFNNQTAYDEDLEFLDDVTHLRQREARTAKGRLTIWIKITFNNVEGWKTLPKKFFIKKTWNRYTDEPEVKSDILSRQSLTRFLNKIQFHYVPAVKEKNIFSDYLFALYETVAENETIEFQEPADRLSGAVNSAVSELTEAIKLNLKVESEIRIPSDLKSIFERLEFSTKQDDFKVPLVNRGDGVQVRHIPHILNYISQNNKSLNIWGYEEPENSLEMSNAFELAREFCDSFSKSNQMFVTSHSPAFYGLEGSNVKHFLVKKELTELAEGNSHLSQVRELDGTNTADVELGLAQLIAQRSVAAYEEVAKLRASNKILSELNKPVILTEGKTDAIILGIAWEKLRPTTERSFEVRSCDLGSEFEDQENAGADELKKILEATTKKEPYIRIGIFDRDIKGTSVFQKLRQHNLCRQLEDVRINVNKKSASILLPQVDWGSPYDKYLVGGPCIEMMLPYDALDDGDIKFQFRMGQIPLSNAKGIEWIEKLADSPQLFDDIPFGIVPKFQNKTNIAQKFGSIPAIKFRNFESIFQKIEHVLTLLN